MNAYVLGTLNTALIFALLTCSLALIIAFAGRITIAHAVIAGIGAYAYAILSVAGVPTILAFLAAPVTAALCGALLMALLGRAEAHVFLLGTLALQYVGYEALRRWEFLTNGNSGIAGVPALLDLGVGGAGVATALVLLLVLVVLTRPLTRTWGLKVRSISDDIEASSAFGVDVDREVLRLFLVSCAIAGAAGALIASRDSFLVPDAFNLDLSLALIAMAMLGGTNIWAAALSGAFLTVLPEIIYEVADVPVRLQGPVQQMVYGLILVLVMLFRPHGLGPEQRFGRGGARTATEKSGVDR